MNRSIRAKGAVAAACAACLLVSAFAVSGCSDKGTGFHLLTTASVRSPEVGYLHTPDGPVLYAGGSILRLERGKLREVMRLADSYLLAVRSQPQVFPALADRRADFLEDGRLLLLRQVMRYDSTIQQVVPDQLEVVLLSVTDPEAPVEHLFAAPHIERAQLILEGSPPRVLAVGSSVDSTSVILIDHPVGSDGDASEWTRTVDGVISAVAASPDGIIGIVKTRSTGALEFESTLESLRIDDGTVVSSVLLPAGVLPAALASYDAGDARMWLLDTYIEEEEDRTIPLAMVADGEFHYLEGDLSPDSDIVLLAVGDLRADQPGDELVVQVFQRATRRSSLAIAKVSNGRIELLTETEEIDIATARVVDLDGDGRNEIVGVQRMDESRVMGDALPGRVYVLKTNEEGGYTAIHSEAYKGIGIDGIDVGDLDGDGIQEIIVGYRTESGVFGDMQSHIDVLSLK